MKDLILQLALLGMIAWLILHLEPERRGPGLRHAGFWKPGHRRQ